MKRWILLSLFVSSLCKAEDVLFLQEESLRGFPQNTVSVTNPAPDPFSQTIDPEKLSAEQEEKLKEYLRKVVLKKNKKNPDR